MAEFKYYKRGAGELDTSNFPDILAAGEVTIKTLDEKTFMSLLALNEYAREADEGQMIRVKILGYVAHLRADKDEYQPARLYELLDHMALHCDSIQHESTEQIRSAMITKQDILRDLPKASSWFAMFVGADGSVPKFFPECDLCALKMRESGKVTDMSFPTLPHTETKQIIIVDDLLGGGATIQKLVDIIRRDGFAGPIHMWVAYNEGFHKQEFLDQFESYHIGELV